MKEAFAFRNSNGDSRAHSLNDRIDDSRHSDCEGRFELRTIGPIFLICGIAIAAFALNAIAEAMVGTRATQPPPPAHLGRGDAVRIGPNIRGEYSKTMTITHVMYTLNHGAATVPDDAVVRATATKGANDAG